MTGGGWSLVPGLAWRFLRGRRTRLLDGTARSALLATAIGVAAMVIAMALMTGYREDLLRKILRGNAAVVAYPLSDRWLDLAPRVYDRLLALESVAAVRRVAYGQGSLVSAHSGDAVEVTLRGEDLDQGLRGLGRVEADLEALAGGPVSAPAPERDRELEGAPAADSGARPALPGVVLGAELATRLAPEPGEAMRLMVLGLRDGRPHFRYQSVVSAGTFTSGFSEFDQRMVIVDRALLERLMGTGIGGSFFELELTELGEAAAAAAGAREVLGPEFLVREWRELNEELFTALRLQQLALFFVLGLIVLVSTFNVASGLVVLVRERMRDIGVLAALGLEPRQVQAVFLLFGAVLGMLGTGLGVAIGGGASLLLTRYELIRFDAEVAAIYFLSSVPFRVEAADVAAIVAFTLIVTVAACWAPSRRAGRVRPAVALRYE